MKLFQQLGAVVWALRGVAVASRDLAVWSPFLLLALLRVLSLMLLLFFHTPALIAVAAPVVVFLGGTGATHYPQHLYLLPSMFSTLDLGLSLVVGALATGVTTARFARVFGDRRARPRWATTLPVAASLFLITAIGMSVDPAWVRMTAALPQRVVEANPLVPLVLTAGRVGAALVVQILLAYAIAAVVLQRVSVLRAMRTSVGLLLEVPLCTVLLVGLSTLPVLVFALVVTSTDFSRLDIEPEFVATVLAIQILVELFADLIRVGALTRVFVWNPGRDR